MYFHASEFPANVVVFEAGGVPFQVFYINVFISVFHVVCVAVLVVLLRLVYRAAPYPLWFYCFCAGFVQLSLVFFWLGLCFQVL